MSTSSMAYFVTTYYWKPADITEPGAQCARKSPDCWWRRIASWNKIILQTRLAHTIPPRAPKNYGTVALCFIVGKRLPRTFKIQLNSSAIRCDDEWRSLLTSPLGLLPQTPPKGTFCKKSPWESRKTAFYFQRLHQGIKRPAYTPPAFDGLYFLRMYPSYLLWSLMDCKLG